MRSLARRRWLLPFLTCVVTSLAGTIAESAPAGTGLDEYRRLSTWETGGVRRVPEAGVTLKRDVATITLVKGTLQPLRPAPDGAVLGVVFEGEGKLKLDVPHEVERRQLRRFTKSKVDALDVRFKRMVLLSSADLVSAYCVAVPTDTFARNDVLASRHEDWLKRAAFDADARVAGGRLIPGDEFLLADVETEDHGWIQFRFDSWDAEEVTLSKLQPRNDFQEVWVSLDRAEERRPDGAPGLVRHDLIDLVGIESDVDLTQNNTGNSNSSADRDVEPLSFRTTITYTPARDGALALPLTLHPWAKVSAVSEEGRPLTFVRDRLGARFASIDNRTHDDALLVFLAAPLAKGTTRTLTVEYTLETFNYVAGRSWYPTLDDSLNDLHTAKMTFTLPLKGEVRAVGTQTAEVKQENTKRVTWETNRPTKMVAFAFGKRFDEEKVQAPGGPEVVSFGVERGAVTGNMVRNVGADVANSLAFYAKYFDLPLQVPRMYTSRIEAWHGQAFDGYLQLSGYTYEGEHPGASELFRAHEAAHQYWGHLVGWHSYRDQWLSEAFAEYSAMMFVQAALPKDDYFHEILEAYTSEQLGDQSGSMSKFWRPFMANATREERETIGPIGVGYRASSAMAPYGYTVQAYGKGPLVLHMIRTLMYAVYRSDDNFRKLLQEFAKQYADKPATTDDFRRLLEQQTKSDWKWFFDQWIHGTAIPTYEYDVQLPKSATADGKWDTAITVRQSNVPDGFKMPVCVKVDFDGGKSLVTAVMVQKPEESFHLPLPLKPKSVVFNYEHAVLAKVRKR